MYYNSHVGDVVLGGMDFHPSQKMNCSIYEYDKNLDNFEESYFNTTLFPSCIKNASENYALLCLELNPIILDKAEEYIRNILYEINEGDSFDFINAYFDSTDIDLYKDVAFPQFLVGSLNHSDYYSMCELNDSLPDYIHDIVILVYGYDKFQTVKTPEEFLSIFREMYDWDAVFPKIKVGDSPGWLYELYDKTEPAKI